MGFNKKFGKEEKMFWQYGIVGNAKRRDHNSHFTLSSIRAQSQMSIPFWAHNSEEKQKTRVVSTFTRLLHQPYKTVHVHITLYSMMYGMVVPYHTLAPQTNSCVNFGPVPRSISHTRTLVEQGKKPSYILLVDV